MLLEGQPHGFLLGLGCDKHTKDIADWVTRHSSRAPARCDDKLDQERRQTGGVGGIGPGEPVPGREEGHRVQALAAPPAEGRLGVERPNRPSRAGQVSPGSPVTASALVGGLQSATTKPVDGQSSPLNQGGTAEGRPFRPWTKGAFVQAAHDHLWHRRSEQ